VTSDNSALAAARQCAGLQIVFGKKFIEQGEELALFAETTVFSFRNGIQHLRFSGFVKQILSAS
jgi:hypothetical protein